MGDLFNGSRFKCKVTLKKITEKDQYRGRNYLCKCWINKKYLNKKLQQRIIQEEINKI